MLKGKRLIIISIFILFNIPFLFCSNVMAAEVAITDNVNLYDVTVLDSSSYENLLEEDEQILAAFKTNAVKFNVASICTIVSIEGVSPDEYKLYKVSGEKVSLIENISENNKVAKFEIETGKTYIFTSSNSSVSSIVLKNDTSQSQLGIIVFVVIGAIIACYNYSEFGYGVDLHFKISEVNRIGRN